jgi:hypothetical protein
MTSNCSGFCWKSVNASSDVPKTWTVVSQPVSCSNGVIQSTSGLVEPSSA